MYVYEYNMYVKNENVYEYWTYGVDLVSRIDKSSGLFCKRAL